MTKDKSVLHVENPSELKIDGEEYKKLYRQAISDHIKSAKLNYELQVKINKIWSLLHDKYSLADKSEIFQDIIKIIE